MTVFLSDAGDGILVMARPEGEGVVGDLVVKVSEGQSFMGWSFDELKALGEGEHEIEPKREPNA